MHKMGSAPKLVQTLGLARGVWSLENIVTGEAKARGANACGMLIRPLFVRAEVRKVFETTKHQGKFEMAGVVNIGEDPVNVGKYRVQDAWVGFGARDEGL